MKKKIVNVIMLTIIILTITCGCHNYIPHAEMQEIATDYVNEHEDELLTLFDMFAQLEQSEELDENDYSDIIAFEEEYLLEDGAIRIQYYDEKEKMEIWFDENRDGLDWGIVYCADPSFDPSSVTHSEAYEEIKDEFYIYRFYQGL